MLLGLSLVLIGAVWLLIRYKGTGSVSPATKALRIPEKREDIIARIERSRPSNTMDPYYIENLTAQCLQEIGQAEGWSSSAPLCGGDLWKWKSREDIPNDRRGLTKYLEERFRNRWEERLKQNRVEAEQSRRRYDQCRKWHSQNQDLVDKFLEVAERKVSVLDDYGDENWDALPKEIQTCLLKIAQIDNDADQFRNALRNDRYRMPEKYQWLKSYLEAVFRSFHERQKQEQAGNPEFKNFSGTDFEIYLAKVLKENGFEDVCGTSVTGDQGADLIVKYGSRRIVIQAKCWQGSVGNEAVQEVVAAVGFYHADEGWVITSGAFTPSAKALAQKNNVRLIDGQALRNRQLT